MIGKFMRGERGLTLESVGKILDTLGCVLTVGKNRFASRPVGRPKKVVPAPESLSSSALRAQSDLGDTEEKADGVKQECTVDVIGVQADRADEEEKC
jgi:hypothetical protein